jgi:hypothetical protein
MDVRHESFLIDGDIVQRHGCFMHLVDRFVGAFVGNVEFERRCDDVLSESLGCVVICLLFI